MNLEAQISISTNMDCPVGLPSFFFLNRVGSGFHWERDEEKITEEYFEDPDMYLSTVIYNILAKWEILCAEEINLHHWNFISN